METKYSNNILTQKSVKDSAKYFLTSGQSIRNRCIDEMFREQPAIVKFMSHLERAHANEANKEVIIQLVTIFYRAFKHQNIKFTVIDNEFLIPELVKSREMKDYFHNRNYNFDGSSFKMFFEDFAQKEILNYTSFAISNQYREYIRSENDALFIFYVIKTMAEIFDKSILKENAWKL